MKVSVVIAEAWRSLTASLSTTLASALTVLIGMFLVGLLIGLGTWARSWSEHAKGQLDINVYLCTPQNCKAAVTTPQKNAVRVLLQNDPRVASVDYISKEQALEIMRKKQPDLVKSVPANPLPDAFKVHPKHGEDVVAIANSLDPLPPGVENVNFGKKTATRILRVAHIFEVLSALAIIILLGAATILIGNTIRLSIFARRREIEVMKLVGASNWFVRGPFVVEGLLTGVLGAAAAIVLLFLGKELVLPATIGRLDAGKDVNAIAFEYTALMLLCLGLVLGAAGSTITMRRFLRV
ncbi:MAG TPA: permease-like cell division protein FtsX [Gaiellaceae bacterium]|nr:permease-like cell division protein FtsX [Gaiellaceae bacterium]